MITVTRTSTDLAGENAPGNAPENARENVQGNGVAPDPETKTTGGTIVGEVVIGTIEAGEKTPATGLGGGETILLTRGTNIDGTTAETVPTRMRALDPER